MELRHLRYFRAVAEELHFRRAAQRLNITQAPLSLAIQALEEELGGQLFRRSRRQVALTVLGANLLVEATAILERVERCRKSMESLVKGEAGQLRVGFTPACSLMPFFPRLISNYRRDFPNVRISLTEASTRQQIEDLESNSLDVALVRGPHSTWMNDISLTKLTSDSLVVAMNNEHRLAKRDAIAISDLNGEPFIHYPKSAGVGIYEKVVELCVSRGFTPNIVQEVREASTLAGLAATGLGVAIVPSGLRHIAIPRVVFKPLSDSDATADIFLANRRGEPNILITTFHRMARTALRDG